MVEWRKRSWGDIVVLEYGKGLSNYRDGTGQYPVFGTNGPIGWHTEPLCPHPGVIVGRQGAYRGIHFSPTPFYVIDTAFYLNPTEELDLRWAYYELRTKDINSMDSGSAIPSTSRPDFYNLPVCVPPLATQRRIAAILGALDDKIELNRQTNQTLEQIAQAIFKSWFIDFDGCDDLVNSELGMIPKGWRVGTLGDVMVEKRITVQPQDLSPDTPYIGLANMPQGSITLTEWGLAEEATSAKISFAKGDILFGKLRPYFKKVGIAPMDGICSSDMLVIRASDLQWYGFGLCLLTYDPFIQYTSAVSTGTRMPRVSWKAMSAYKVAIPPDKLAGEFSEVVNAFALKMLLNIEESRSLAELRDTILPKLISGELDVSQIEVTDLGSNISSEVDSAQMELPLKVSAP